jgi:predicted dehydrogenase
MKNTSRRGFIRSASALTVGSSLGFPAILSAQDPGKKLNIAAIGAGGKGESDLAGAAEGNNVVAICDVDRQTLAKALQKYGLPESRGFTDFRKMLDTVKEIDGVTVSGADHSHYPSAMHAIALGKHVCVQKPLVNTIWEANELHAAAKKKGVITNMGNQGHTGEGIRNLKTWIEAGAIGAVKEIHVWTNRPIWAQGTATGYKESAAPSHLDWTAWQASVPERPFMVNKEGKGLHPFEWRGHTDYGAGAMGDMGCHIMDGAFWACSLGMPTKIEVDVEEMGELYWPKSGVVTSHFDKGIILKWYEGGRKPERPAALEAGRELPIGGFFIVGEKGTIYEQNDYCNSPRLLPETAHRDFMAKKPERKIPSATHPGNPQAEWTHAIKNNLVCGSNFDYSVPLTKLCLLGNLAMRIGKTIEWDNAKNEVKGMPEAQKFLKRTYREGWEYSAAKI